MLCLSALIPCCGVTKSESYCNYLAFLICNCLQVWGSFLVWLSFPCCMLGVRVVLVTNCFILVVNVTIFYGSSHSKINQTTCCWAMSRWKGFFIRRSLLDRIWLLLGLYFSRFLLFVALWHLCVLSGCSGVKGRDTQKTEFYVCDSALVHLSTHVLPTSSS